MAGGLIDEGRSEGRVSGELECAAAHRGVVGVIDKVEVIELYMWLQGLVTSSE